LWRETHNINKVSVEEIAREAGVSPTTVYNNFGTREGLVQAVVRHLTDEIMQRMENLLTSDLPFPQKMQQMVYIKLNSVSGMQSELIEKIWGDPASRKYIEEMTENRAKPLMKNIIEQGQQQGFIHPDIPPEVFMLYFNILQAGGEANKVEMARVAGDKSQMTAIARLMYFGIFAKTFDMESGNTTSKESR
jgi:AcrR family transcriptional regulator